MDQMGDLARREYDNETDALDSYVAYKKVISFTLAFGSYIQIIDERDTKKKADKAAKDKEDSFLEDIGSNIRFVVGYFFGWFVMDIYLPSFILLISLVGPNTTLSEVAKETHRAQKRARKDDVEKRESDVQDARFQTASACFMSSPTYFVTMLISFRQPSTLTGPRLRLISTV